MAHQISFIAISLLAFVFTHSSALGIDTDKETGDDANGVPISLFLSNQAARPDNPALRISRSIVDRIAERLRSHNAVTAGMAPSEEVGQVLPAPTPANEWFAHPGVFAEYDYINSASKLPNGADSQTNSASLGASFFTKYAIGLGLGVSVQPSG
jgi:hypothetical protein